MADPITNPNDIQPYLDQIEQQIHNLQQQAYDIDNQFNAQNTSLLGPQIGGLMRQKHQIAQTNINKQIAELRFQYNKAFQTRQQLVRDQQHAQGADARARAEADRQQKAVAAQRKADTDNLEKASAAQFGLGPKRGIQSLLAQGAVYDPVTKRVVVPSKEGEKLTTEDKAKAKRNADQVNNELNSAAKANGYMGKIAPQSVFGQTKPEPDADGKLNFDIAGQNLQIPEKTYDDLKDKYDNSIAQATPQPTRTVNPDLFNQYQQQLNLLNPAPGAIPQPSLVDEAIARESNARRALPGVLASQNQNLDVRTIPAWTGSEIGGQPGLTLPAAQIERLQPTISGLNLPNDNFFGASIIPETRLAPFQPGYQTQAQIGDQRVDAVSQQTGLPKDKILAIQAAGLKNGYAVDSPETQGQLRLAAASASGDRLPSLIGQGVADIYSMAGTPWNIVYNSNRRALEAAAPYINRGVNAITPTAPDYTVENQFRAAQGLAPIEDTSNAPFYPF